MSPHGVVIEPTTLAPTPCPEIFRERWRELIGGLDAHALAETFLERVALIPYYREHMLPSASDSRIEPIAVESLAALIACLDDRVGPDDAVDLLTPVAAPLGMRRARADVPAEALMSAIRVDFSVLWDALVSMGTTSFDSRMLVDRASTVWAVVETYAAITHQAYERERSARDRETDAVIRGLVATLLGTSTVTNDVAVQAALDLGLDPGARFGVAVVPQRHLESAAGILNEAGALGAQSFTFAQHGRTSVLWVEPQGPRTVDAPIGEQLALLPCGLVRDVAGAEHIPVAAHAAEYLYGLLRPSDTGALDADRSWARIARDQLERAGFELARESARSLRELAPGERARLSATVRAFLETGSVPAAARRLHYHRNTALNHLRRFTDVTGLDVTIPADAALVVVAGLVGVDGDVPLGPDSAAHPA